MSARLAALLSYNLPRKCEEKEGRHRWSQHCAVECIFIVIEIFRDLIITSYLVRCLCTGGVMLSNFPRAFQFMGRVKGLAYAP